MALVNDKENISEGGDKQSSEDGVDDDQDFVFLSDLNRPPGWRAWEEKTKQRPAPLHPPRLPDFEYANMTIRAIENEDGAQIFSQFKDNYMLSLIHI